MYNLSGDIQILTSSDFDNSISKHPVWNMKKYVNDIIYSQNEQASLSDYKQCDKWIVYGTNSLKPTVFAFLMAFNFCALGVLIKIK